MRGYFYNTMESLKLVSSHDQCLGYCALKFASLCCHTLSVDFLKENVFSHITERTAVHINRNT